MAINNSNAAVEDLAAIQKALVLLCKHHIITDDFVIEGMEKFVKEHPELQGISTNEDAS